MPTLVHRLLRVVEADPSKVFVHTLQGERETALSYGDLLCRAAVYREHLASLGVGPGDIVLIILRHGPDAYPCFLGAMLLGAVPSFMPFRTPKQDSGRYWEAHRLLFERTGAKALITYQENLDALRAALPDAALAILTTEAVQDRPQPNLAEALALACVHPAESGDVAFLQHSSGTTGLKKGVMLSHRAVLRQLDAYRGTLNLEPVHGLASWLPLYHDMGLIACFLLPMVTGCTLVALDPFEWVVRPTLLLDAIQRHSCQFVWQPNFAFHHLARCAPEGETWELGSLIALVNCSEPCKPEAFEAFLDRFGTMGAGPEVLQVCYAMAETVFAVTQTRPGCRVQALRADPGIMAEQGRIETSEHGLGMLSCGPPVPGTTVTIRGDDGRALPEDRIGEVVVTSDYLFDGYFRLPDATAAKLRRGALWTGDLGFLHRGELYITGRRDDQITINGQNYYAHDIEACLAGLPGLVPGRCVAVARPNPAQGSHEVVIIAETDPEPEATALRRAVKQRVLDALGLMVAQVALKPRGWLIKTTSGKLSRKANLAKWQGQAVKP